MKKSELRQIIKEELQSYTNVGLADFEEYGFEEGIEIFKNLLKKYQFKNSPDFNSFKKGLIQGITDEASNIGL